MTPRFWITQVCDITGRSQGGIHGFKGCDLIDDHQRDQMAINIEHIFGENIAFIGIEKQKTDEFAGMKHRHGIAGSIAVTGNSARMFMRTLFKCHQIIDDTRQTLGKNLFQ